MPWSDFQMAAEPFLQMLSLKCSDWGGTGGLAPSPWCLWGPLGLRKRVLQGKVSSAMRPTPHPPLLKPVRAESALDQYSVPYSCWALGRWAVGTEAWPSSMPTLPGSSWPARPSWLLGRGPSTRPSLPHTLGSEGQHL